MNRKKAIQSSLSLKILVLMVMAGLSSQALAQSIDDITPEQIAQFSALPASLQQQFAGQLGVDLSALQALSAGGEVNQAPAVGQPGEPLVPYEADEPLELAEALVEEAASELVRYGLTLFDREVSTFAPVDNAPVPSDYVVGPGDSFNVLLFGADNQSLLLSVDREGVINFPRLGAISVAGLTFAESKRLIETRVNEQLIGVDAVISAGRLRAINVFMAGEVKTPGAYSVSGLTTVTQALFVAGGVSNIGTLRNVQVLRQNEVIATFDAYDLLLRGDASQDIRLQSGDVVFVPPLSTVVSIDGAVRRPAIYELIAGQSVTDLVEMAGRFETNAYIKMVTLKRFDRNDALPKLINLDLTSAEDNALSLLDGDYIQIPVAGETFSNNIQIKGAVIRPGTYAYEEGMRISDLLPGVDSHLNSDTDLNYALLVSIKNERLDIEVTSFDLGRAITNPGSEWDPMLSSRDEILVFDLTEGSKELMAGVQPDLSNQGDETPVAITIGENTALAAAQIQEASNRRSLLAPVITKLRLQSRENEPVQIVSVSGAVKAPGEYPLKPGDRLSLLLTAAGGLTGDAFLNEAELRRVMVDNQGFADIEITAVDLTLRLTDDQHNPILASRDHIFVRAIPEWTPSRSVDITGEVRFPGTYQIGPRETIRGVITRAGGLTNIAFAAGAIFTRESARDLQRAQLVTYVDDIRKTVAAKSLTLEAQSIDIQELESIVSLMINKEPLGRLIIDFPAIFAGNTVSDIVVQDGDSIEIPRVSNTISVIGEVRREGFYRYQDSLTLDDCLELSAGMTVRADEDAIYVIKADGSVDTLQNNLFSFSGPSNSLSPGDTIVIPVNPQYRDTISYWSTVTGIIYQTGIAAATAIALF
jgi:polysaccharide export outer membrane protein